MSEATKFESKFVLEGECPPGVRVSYALTGDKMIVGRNGDIVLYEPSVSREHAVLTRVGDAWRVTDAGSSNGTFVNGVSVQRQMVHVGDMVGFGRVKLVLSDLNAHSDDAATFIPTMRLGTGENQTAEGPDGPSAQSLVGRSDALKAAMKIAARAAKSSATVLLYGESGTGKELFAKLVWEESERAGKKFLPVHSGAIEQSLLASALFGYEKGAFTGADKQKRGLFEEADGGTIFLDEIGEINAETQVKLLRVLQEGEFMRVGGTEPIKVDVRVICATNRDLAAAVREGRFREDLYYRLNVIQIKLPPLRERQGDIEDLVNHYAALFGGAFRRVGREAMDVLCRYRWPGNVRELRNVVERIFILSDKGEIGVDDLPEEIRAAVASAPAATPTTAPTVPVLKPGRLDEWEKQVIAEALKECRGNKSMAAKQLGMSRSALYEKIKKYGLE